MHSRLTRFNVILVVSALAVGAITLGFQGTTRWLLLALVCTTAGLWVGLGVSFPSWRMFGTPLCRVATRRRAVALTFDDGPDPANTPPLLELLARREAHATFFCVGTQVADHPELVRRMAQEGHELENHSYRHNPWTNLFGAARLRQDLQRAQEQLREVTGRSPIFFRPPMGLTNQRVYRVAAELGLFVVGYSARGLDRRPDNPETIATRLLRGAGPGSILLLHDRGVPRERLLAVVAIALDRLKSEGYECVRLDELAKDGTWR
ncbi:MAG: polysaccharide deacetylase family protein [Verrucomicrobiales bacterium]|nr:polysaccharide deacetylase family protein [Verrucomicrobiales bacterium]